MKLTNEQFIAKAKNIHGERYDYSKVLYNGARSKIVITCPKHGEFLQLPFNHFNGVGCPKCNESHGERNTRRILEKENIEFIEQFSFPDLRGKKKPLVIDFFLPELRTCIEYDGRQHSVAVDFFGGEESLMESKRLDGLKNEYCKNNNIKMIRIPYTVKDIETFLLEKLRA